VSTMIVDAHEHGLPGDGPQLAVFGSGRYRSSDVYLGEASRETRRARWLLFYAGGLSRPQWSRSEDSAVLLFCAGSVGELWFAGTRAGSLDMPLQRRLASR
jgi:hypothetical protein